MHYHFKQVVQCSLTRSFLALLVQTDDETDQNLLLFWKLHYDYMIVLNAFIYSNINNKPVQLYSVVNQSIDQSIKRYYRALNSITDG